MQIDKSNLFNKNTNLFNTNANNKLFKVIAKYILVSVVFATSYCIYVDINLAICYKIKTTIIYISNLLKVFNRVLEVLS